MGTATEAITAPIPATHDRWHPSTAGWVARLTVLVLIFGGVLWVTAIVPQYWADRISLAVIYCIIGLSLNVVLGYVGQVSLGHHAFVGIAAFVAAFYVTEQAGCTAELGCPFDHFLAGIGLGVLSGGVAALLLGLVALRIRGLYLALITLTYGFMAERSIFEIPSLTRGGAGMPAPRPDGILGLNFTSDRGFAFLTFVFLALVLFVDWRLLRSKVGRAILSIKHSEPVAASYGINVTAYKLLAFILSGMFAGLAGGLMAFRATTVVSNDFNFSIALLWVLMVVVGGLGNRTGVVVISAFFALFPFLPELWTAADRFVVDTLERSMSLVTIVFGALLALLTIIQFPGGFAEQVSPITRWLRGQKFSMHPEGEGGHSKGHDKSKSDKGGGLLAKLGLHRGEHDEPAEEADEPEGKN
ncbi:MAG TPA: branched-chain amino acid ABC transporter permease [Actinomycetota bacterium]|nr:branched-chain amino acid ABC transporter permease [Actinomycetota bacterium]